MPALGKTEPSRIEEPLVSLQCPACGSTDANEFFEAASVPVFCNVLWDDVAQARSAPRGSIRLYACDECRLVFNGAFDPNLLDYGPGYENSLHCSPHFQQFAERLARHLVERFNLRREVILEVGCGRAEFLALLCRLGGNHGTGFDQSFDPTAGQPDAGVGTIQIEKKPFPASAAGLIPALTLCRHVLEHIPQPRPFVEALASVAGRRRGSGVYVEVPNVMYTLRDLGIWDVIYEHCTYFGTAPLTRLLASAGVRVTAAYAAYGEQFLCVEGTVQGGLSAPAIDDGEKWDLMISAFADHQRGKVAEWSDRLKTRRSHGDRIALWGAGSKGVTFLNMVSGSDVISHVIDLNPRKHGRFTGGTGHRIEPPTALLQDPPAAVLVMNPLYLDEISSQLSDLGIAPILEIV